MFTPQKYPQSMIYFHALVAVLMITTLILGWTMTRENGLMFYHKSFGVLVLVFAVFRIINRMRNTANLPPSVNRGGLRIIEKSVHGLLMLAMLGLPLMGWLTSNANGRAVSVFGLFDLPTLMGKNDVWGHRLGELHENGATVFFILLVVHVAGVVYHRVQGKHENVLARMLPWG